MTHRIASVRFVRKTNDGPCVCDCGWDGLASEFSWHRASVGLSASAPIRMGTYRINEPNPWVRNTHCKRGHRKSPENTYMERGKPHGCLLCRRETARAQYAARHAGAAA